MQKANRMKIYKPIKDRIAPFVFIAPAIMMLIVLSVVPILYSFGLSLFKYNLAKPASSIRFYGIQNYVRIFSNKDFLSAIAWTFSFTAITVVIELIMGMILALTLNSSLCQRFSGPFKTLLLIPMMICAVVSATVWKLMFYPIYGVVNCTLDLIGMQQVSWLNSAVGARAALIIVDIWLTTPFCMLIFHAALKTVPVDIHEAARIDGANEIQIFFKITLPMILNFIALVVVVRVSDALRVFDTILQLTDGGPGTATETIGTLLYKRAFHYSNIGEGAAGSFVFFLLICIISSTLFVILRKKDD